jgi:hypothetical protein
MKMGHTPDEQSGHACHGGLPPGPGPITPSAFNKAPAFDPRKTVRIRTEREREGTDIPGEISAPVVLRKP